MNGPGTGTGRYIGQRVRRKEDPRLLTGRGQFVDDIAMPGMLHVAFARSPIARGNILSINTEGARDIPGVHAVYTQKELARFKVDMTRYPTIQRIYATCMEQPAFDAAQPSRQPDAEA